MGFDSRISLHKLEVLSLVVRLQGIGKAADALGVAQPVVTAHIRSLEERLGAKIFYRDGRGLKLTEAGASIVEWAEEVLTQTRELERQLTSLSEGTAGSLIFGASMSIGSYSLPRILTGYRSDHPEVQVRLSISDTEHVINDTRAGMFDFGIVVGESDLEVPDMIVEQIATDDMVFVAAVDWSRTTTNITIEELATLPFIDAPAGIVRRGFIDRCLREVGVTERDVVLELGHPEAMKLAAREGLGVAVMFRSSVAEELARKELCEITVVGVNVKFPVYLIFRKSKSFSRAHERLIETIRADFQRGISAFSADSAPQMPTLVPSG